MACGRPSADDARPAATIVLPDSAYRALPAITLVDAPVRCEYSGAACRATFLQIAATLAPSQVLFTGSEGKRLQLLLADADSGRTIALGRVGDGPGEYRFLHAVGFSRAGEPLAFDPMQRRVNRFAPDGRVHTSMVPVPPGLILPAFVGGELRALATEPSRPGDSASVAIFALDSGARAARRVAMLPVRQPGYSLSDLRPVPMPFAPVPQWAWREDGSVLHSDGSTLLIDVYDPNGAHTLRFGFETESRRVTEADLATERATRMRNVHDPRMIAALEESARRGAARHPAITRIVALGNGQVWVRESPDAKAGTVTWIVFEGSGQAIGRIELGTDDAVLASQGDMVVLTRESDAAGTDLLRWVTTPASAAAR